MSLDHRAIQTLYHPYISSTRDTYFKGDEFRVVSYWTKSGVTLEEFLREKHKDRISLSEDELLHYFSMIALAIEQTHY